MKGPTLRLFDITPDRRQRAGRSLSFLRLAL